MRHGTTRSKVPRRFGVPHAALACSQTRATRTQSYVARRVSFVAARRGARGSAGRTFGEVHEQRRHGVSIATHRSRSARFGANLVDVQIKSPLLILVDEVLHPFYVFQVRAMLMACGECEMECERMRTHWNRATHSTAPTDRGLPCCAVRTPGVVGVRARH